MSAFTNELLKLANLEIAKLKDVLANHDIKHCCFCGEYENPRERNEDGDLERGDFDRGWGKHFHPECYAKNGHKPPT